MLMTALLFKRYIFTEWLFEERVDMLVWKLAGLVLAYSIGVVVNLTLDSHNLFFNTV
jgi:hypothetical protein